MILVLPLNTIMSTGAVICPDPNIISKEKRSIGKRILTIFVMDSKMILEFM